MSQQPKLHGKDEKQKQKNHIQVAPPSQTMHKNTTSPKNMVLIFVFCLLGSLVPVEESFQSQQTSLCFSRFLMDSAGQIFACQTVNW